MRKSWRRAVLGVAGAVLALALLSACGSQTLQKEADRQVLTYEPIQTSYQQLEKETAVFATLDDLQAFCESHGALAEDASYQQSFGTLEETFFEDHILICAVLPGGSGAERFEIETVDVQADGTVRMEISREKGEAGTAVMSQWYLFAEISRNGMETVPETFELVVNT